MSSQDTVIKRCDRESLLKICRLRAKVAKAELAVVAARRKAEFEAQLAKIYSCDTDEIWKKAHTMAAAVTAQANIEIAERAEELGIPKEFMPSLSARYWRGRDENAIRSNRLELTRVAHSKIDQLQKDAELDIERRSAEVQTRIVAAGLESEAERVLLDSMPTAKQLLPPVTVEEAQKDLTAFLESADDLPF